MPATPERGNGQRFLLMCSRAYPSADDIFHMAFTANPEAPTEGMLGATS